MASSSYFDPRQLRAEIAALAARLIAEEGSDYGHAKRHAARQLLGNARVPAGAMPDHAEVEQAVRAYQALFLADSQPRRLLQLRQLALYWMRRLEPFAPHLVGAVANGTAGAHSDVHLHLYVDNTKDVAIFLLNQGVDFEVSETFDARGQGWETLSFLWQHEGVHLVLFDSEARRHPHGKQGEHWGLAQLEEALGES